MPDKKRGPRTRIDWINWVWEVDWSSWVVGFEVDTDWHWSRKLKMYYVTLYFGPFLLGLDFDGKEHN